MKSKSKVDIGGIAFIFFCMQSMQWWIPRLLRQHLLKRPSKRLLRIYMHLSRSRWLLVAQKLVASSLLAWVCFVWSWFNRTKIRRLKWGAPCSTAMSYIGNGTEDTRAQEADTRESTHHMFFVIGRCTSAQNLILLWLISRWAFLFDNSSERAYLALLPNVLVSTNSSKGFACNSKWLRRDSFGIVVID